MLIYRTQQHHSQLCSQFNRLIIHRERDRENKQINQYQHRKRELFHLVVGANSENNALDELKNGTRGKQIRGKQK